MALLSLGKATVNNVTGNYQPNFGLLAPLAGFGMVELRQGNGDLNLQPPLGLSDGDWFIIKIVQLESIGDRAVTWDANYAQGFPYFTLFTGHQGDQGGDDPYGQKTAWTALFLRDKGRTFMSYLIYTDP